MTLSLFLFGPFRLRFAQRHHLLTGYSAALLGYLALQPHASYSVSRSRLVGTLWPDYDEEHARRLLSNALYRLQKQHPQLAEHLRLTSDVVALDDVWVDVQAFEADVSASEPARWQSGLERYQGQLLEELDMAWLDSPRALLHERYLSTLARTCRHLEQTAVHTLHKALHLAHRWVQAEPFDEEAHRTLMRLYVRLGRPAAARRQYEQLAATLAAELNLAPQPATKQLAQQLPQSSPSTLAEKPALFVGRQSERTQLSHHIEALSGGRGGIILIEGEAGLGKSALLHEAEKTAVWRQRITAQGEASRTTSHPFAPLPLALQRLAQKPPLQTAVAALSPLIRQLLTPLLSPTTATAAPTSSPFVPTTPLAAALRHLLQSWLRQTPLLLLLDDLHLADESFWTLLPTLTALSQEQPLLLLLAYRGWELRQKEAAWRALQAIEKNAAPARLTLSGLSIAETKQLAAAFPQEALDVTKLHQLSGGNPLLLRELLAQPKRAAAELAPLLANRLARLSTEERDALAAAAVLAGNLDVPLWSALVKRPLSGQTLSTLINGRFLRETEAGLRFQHELLRLHLYQQLAQPERQALHRQAAQLLEPTASPALLAHHFEQGELWETAVHYYHRAAEQALAINAYETADRWVNRGLDIARHAGLPPAHTLPSRALYCTIAYLRQPTGELLSTVSQLEDEARRRREEETLLRLLLVRFDLLVGRGEQERVTAVGNEILRLAEGVGNLPLEVDALCQISIKTAFMLGQAKEAIPFAQQAVTLAEQANRPAQLAQARLTLAACLLRQRQLEAAKGELTAVKQLLDAQPELIQIEAEWLYLWGMAAQIGGDWEAAYRIHLQSVAAHRQGGNFYGLTSSLYNAANHASGRGSHEEAILLAQEMVDLAEEQLAEEDVEKRLRYRSMLAGCYELAGEYETAEAVLAPLRSWLETDGSGATAVRGWSILGSIRFGQQQLEEAYQAHEQAVTLGKSLSSVSASPFLAHAEICHLTNRHAKAATSLQEAAARLNFTGRTSHSHTYFYYVRFLLEGKTADLQQAYEVMIEQSQRFTQPADQQQYLDRFSLHRDIQEARVKRLPPPLTVQLARSDAPLGRSLKTADFVSVQWTVDAGETDAKLLAAEGAVALRRQRLQRLMREAKTQGGRPTYADLAAALEVSERTIERDAKWLEEQGIALYTRKKERGTA